ncbi:hypothetical protein [Bacillus thuringiensis]|uniref:Uncharacterized protein n=1 Tax=Bacillus thuringiensis YBT-1518 TaxID=529122 RepID=A0A9W3KEX3_BACTU|nr:hypothetical protein [Bacillus thuringiensis]AHA73478.1 hypothetical protein YBT1518_21760 [Bacillus thuringiensis YBT-1518]EKS8362630.1 hypothetical protein [Bacillus cereus]EKS8370138.1 hypothetical protein [Bacillus cereus]
MKRDNFDPGGLGGNQLKYDPNSCGGDWKDSGGGMGMYNPGAGGGYIKDPGTGI